MSTDSYSDVILSGEGSISPEISGNGSPSEDLREKSLSMLVSIEGVAAQYEIMPLDLTRNATSVKAEEVVRKLGRMPMEATPWLPVTTVGPVLVMAHHNPDSADMWGVPPFLAIKVVISHDKYEDILADLVKRISRSPLPQESPLQGLEPPGQDMAPLEVMNWYLQNYPMADSEREKLHSQITDAEGKTEFPDLLRFGSLDRHLGVALEYMCTGSHIFNPEDAPKQEMFSESLLEKHSVYPLYCGKQRVYLITADTSNYAFEDEWISAGNDPIDMVRVLGDARSIKEAISRSRSKAGGGETKIEITDDLHFADDTNMVDIDPGAMGSIDPKNINISPEELMHWILYNSIINRASDLHVEKYYNMARFRARVDGSLKVIHTCPEEMLPRYIALIKNWANMGQSRQEAQDARFAIAIDKRRVDVRVSAVPCRKDLQKLTMRFLDKQDGLKKLTDLNLAKRQSTLIKRAMSRDQGLILVTGPTGSGKTTTLYALIDSVNSVDRNIHTIEDPIEFEIEGINQTQTDEVHELTFPRGLRALLRADPDVILIGESRDQETANAAVNAALTGHLVLTTLHANDCIRAVSRLLSMGLEPYLLADSLALTQAQRLVKRLCTYCKRQIEASREMQEHMYRNGVITEPLKAPIYESVGCPECHNSGYSGRVALMELTEIGPELADLIVDGAPQSKMRELAVKGGLLTLYQEGLIQVLAGTTTVKEISRLSYTGVA